MHRPIFHLCVAAGLVLLTACSKAPPEHSGVSPTPEVAAVTAEGQPLRDTGLPWAPRPRDDAAAKLLEPMLKAQDDQQLALLVGCEKQAEAAGDAAQGSYEVSYERGIEKAGLYAYTLNRLSQCGSAVPAASQVGYIYSMATGEPYDLLRLYKVARPADLATKDKIESRQLLRLVPSFHQALLQKLQSAVPSEAGLRCNEQLSREFPGIRRGDIQLNQAGLTVAPDGGQPLKECLLPVTFTYEELASYLNPAEQKQLGWAAP